MRSSDDDIDVGKFFAWAARPRETPGRNEDLHRIVRRYLDEPDFASVVDRVFSGAGLDLQVDGRDGIIVTARHHALLRLNASDIVKRAQPSHRTVLGAVLLAVARTAYPESGMVDDPDRVAVFTTQSVVDTLAVPPSGLPKSPLRTVRLTTTWSRAGAAGSICHRHGRTRNAGRPAIGEGR
ncbi:hypothetical protein AB5J62_15175 [Amycolatopsis sp. cg5]|uniref:hypothetical protein n=1 Tax=Amycolatopsis sp. cg5 TaxID=3238802 RepID=UPI00352504EC